MRALVCKGKMIIVYRDWLRWRIRKGISGADLKQAINIYEGKILRTTRVVILHEA